MYLELLVFLVYMINNMEESLLIENRNSLKDIFYRHLAEKEASNISYKQFFKFCCTVKIYPDLISSFELKRILSSTLKKKNFGWENFRNFLSKIWKAAWNNRWTLFSFIRLYATYAYSYQRLMSNILSRKFGSQSYFICLKRTSFVKIKF